MNTFEESNVYSFVIPIHNEEETLEELYRRLSSVMEELDGASEVILVDDGSTDRSCDIISDLYRRDPRFKSLFLSRNFGHQMAITAGLDHASGNAVIIMDGDLQDPPELVPELVARWHEGYDVVYAVRDDRLDHSRFRTVTASLFYRTLRRLTSEDIPANVGDFRLVDRRVLNAALTMRERNRFLRGMFSWVGFKQTGVRFVRQGRYAGSTKYPVTKLATLAVDGIVSFSNVPLRFALSMGFLVSVVAFLTGFLAIVGKLVGVVEDVPGWASIVFVTSFLGGVQLVMIGVMGEYIGRIYEEVKQRPLYVVRDEQGLSGSSTPPRQSDAMAPAGPPSSP
jgi:glycosyltransferase involved in cell wall biosynthesis